MDEQVEQSVKNLHGKALNWAVAKSLGWHLIPAPPDINGENGNNKVLAPPEIKADEWAFPPRGKIPSGYFLRNWANDWSQGGPLIQRFKIQLKEEFPGWMAWGVMSGKSMGSGCGKTPLVAACRAIVAAKFGSVIEVPADLIEPATAGKIQ